MCFRDNLNPMFDRYIMEYLRGEGKVEASPIEQLSFRLDFAFEFDRILIFISSIVSLLKYNFNCNLVFSDVFIFLRQIYHRVT